MPSYWPILYLLAFVLGGFGVVLMQWLHKENYLFAVGGIIAGWFGTSLYLTIYSGDYTRLWFDVPFCFALALCSLDSELQKRGI